MNFRVEKHTLLYTAGLIWIIAGANILRIGLVTWFHNDRFHLFQVAEALAVFLFFFLLIFRRLFRKHTARIVGKQGKSCPFSFFDKKGWIVMTGMIAAGILIRRFHWAPASFISVFYTGLATALLITGVLFLRRGRRERKKAREQTAPPSGETNR